MVTFFLMHWEGKGRVWKGQHAFVGIILNNGAPLLHGRRLKKSTLYMECYCAYLRIVYWFYRVFINLFGYLQLFQYDRSFWSGGDASVIKSMYFPSRRTQFDF